MNGEALLELTASCVDVTPPRHANGGLDATGHEASLEFFNLLLG